ncbi:hypothetical protein FRC08_013848 [Ceratobasidium sp. 394]|nr:hypothetical protein FRC08_013848 [Ceratobasidium sp. 394]
MLDSVAPSQIALGTPELLHNIFSHATASDLARSSRVSQLFFFCASPALWKDLKGVLKLLKTIPCLEISKTAFYTYDQTTSREVQRLEHREVLISLPETLDLTRFDYYASLVQTLEVFDNTSVSATYLIGYGWDKLRKYQVAQPNGLAPNLLSLSLVNALHIQNNYAWATLTQLFICPRLEELRIPYFDGEAELNSNRVFSPESTVYRNLVRCPMIHTLELSHTSCVPNLEFLSRMQSLRHLVTFVEIIYDPRALAALASLPRLISLSLRGHSHNEFLSPVVLPKTAFPALRMLTVVCAFPSTVQAIWGIAPLVRRLTTVDLKIHYNHRSANTSPGWVDSVLLPICASSPDVVNLQLHIRGRRCYRISITGTHLGLLRSLRLRCISFVHMILMRSVPFTEFVSSFPDAQEFRYTSETIDFYDLHQLAVHMPHLRLLFIQSVRQWDRPFSAKDVQVPASKQPITVYSGWNAGRDLVKGLEDTARILHAIWPNVQCAVPPDCEKLAIKNVRLLNEAIDRLRHM